MPPTPYAKRSVLTSWKEIAQYMRKGVRTVQRWEQDSGLPVRRAHSSDKKAVLARPQDLDSWSALRGNPVRGHGERPARPRSVEMRSRLADDLQAARLLREDSHALMGEFSTSLALLSERLAVMTKKDV
jgi:hypothetical protein